MRFPRPCRFLARRLILASQFGVGETLTADLTHCQMKAVSVIQRVVFRGAIVEAKHMFGDIAVKMKRFHSNVGSAQSALQETPKVLDSLRMDFATNILFDMVNGRMNIVLRRKMIVGRKAVSVDCRSAFDLIQNLILKSLAFDVRDNFGTHLPTLTVEHSHNRCRGVLPVGAVNLEPPRAMHLLRLRAYMRLVHFDWTVAAHLQETSRLHCFADAVKHEPRRLLSNADSLSQFVTADTFLARRQHPHSGHPFVHADRRILENGSDLHRELLLAAVAEPYPAGLQERVEFRAAAGAVDAAIRPAKLNGIAKCAIWVREVNDCLLESYRSFEGVGHKALHQTKNSLRRMFLCVKYIIAVTTMGITCAAKVWRTF